MAALDTWLFSNGEIGWGIFMGLWGLFVVSTVDNIIRPYFISIGSALPLILVFLGLLGGIAAFGLLGVFIGPTLLAVGYTLVREWSHSKELPSPSTSPTTHGRARHRPLSTELSVAGVSSAGPLRTTGRGNACTSCRSHRDKGRCGRPGPRSRIARIKRA